jgi:hypothetical protein
MAKIFHLKEIIDYEEAHPDLRSFDNGKKEVEARTSWFSSGNKFLDELKLWKTALQIEAFAHGRSHQK